MINILSYVGMNMQSEVCLWTLLGLVRIIFDATLFKVNANLKQVWQMSMPAELSMPLQRVLRTMISGVMLVQCFTVYVYLASYIVLLYPVFLEERPALVIPWLLLAAVRKLLCELTSLALGLGTCVLLGPAKPPCIKFLIVKVSSLMPGFYMWMLMYSYYHALKVASAFKTFSVAIPPIGKDYGLELAVRRRCTKSLFGEEQLRKKLVAGFYGERSPCISNIVPPRQKMNATASPRQTNCSESSIEEKQDPLQPLSPASNKYADIGGYEDWLGSDILLHRGDRILEQFVVMLLRIGSYLESDGAVSLKSQMFNSSVNASWGQRENLEAMSTDVTDTPPLVGNNRGHTASYLREYPQIFMKKLSSEIPQPDRKSSQMKNGLYTQSSKSNKLNEQTTLDTGNKINVKATNEQIVLPKPKGPSQSPKSNDEASFISPETGLNLKSPITNPNNKRSNLLEEVIGVPLISPENPIQITFKNEVSSKEELERSPDSNTMTADEIGLHKLKELKPFSETIEEESGNLMVRKLENDGDPGPSTRYSNKENQNAEEDVLKSENKKSANTIMSRELSEEDEQSKVIEVEKAAKP